jgi:hypothetical protein
MLQWQNRQTTDHAAPPTDIPKKRSPKKLKLAKYIYKEHHKVKYSEARISKIKSNSRYVINKD